MGDNVPAPGSHSPCGVADDDFCMHTKALQYALGQESLVVAVDPQIAACRGAYSLYCSRDACQVDLAEESLHSLLRHAALLGLPHLFTLD